MSLLFNMLSRFVIAFFQRSKHLLILWLQSPSTMILEAKKIKSVNVFTFSSSVCHGVMACCYWCFYYDSHQEPRWPWTLHTHSQLFPASISVVVQGDGLKFHVVLSYKNDPWINTFQRGGGERTMGVHVTTLSRGEPLNGWLS